MSKFNKKTKKYRSITDDSKRIPQRVNAATWEKVIDLIPECYEELFNAVYPELEGIPNSVLVDGIDVLEDSLTTFSVKFKNSSEAEVPNKAEKPYPSLEGKAYGNYPSDLDTCRDGGEAGKDEDDEDAFEDRYDDGSAGAVAKKSTDNNRQGADEKIHQQSSPSASNSTEREEERNSNGVDNIHSNGKTGKKTKLSARIFAGVAHKQYTNEEFLSILLQLIEIQRKIGKKKFIGTIRKALIKDGNYTPELMDEIINQDLFYMDTLSEALNL
ncbi:MAG TPA: hypothetical protein VL053_17445 [Arachidicoccus sp.]|nr:hypothetical protein [Arachidicoccus sp.]